ncbi:MAG TPA: histidinol dehydrogenase [Euryarchaeota archaeon]|nr:histidinol dehydrogenase [archaeon BMS3Bbin15]HDL15458.1 histidinol dehydrogenase [Euryarchaeota archaeon]
MKYYILNHMSQKEKISLFRRGRAEVSKAEETVRPIIERVRVEGDKAVKEFTERFDGAKIEEIRVSWEEIEGAEKKISRELVEALETAAENIAEFHRRQLPEEFSLNDNGRELGVIFRAIPRIGCYIPGGRAVYPSTVLMTAIPARVAGVRHIAVATPPGRDGEINPLILAACKIAGVTRVYRMGGAQAIAAFAYGTESIDRVDKIVGPGNIYVTSAKRLMSSEVAVDMPAGPSEILIIADERADARVIAYDLLAQAEHDPDATCILITTSETIGEDVRKILEDKNLAEREEAYLSLEKNGAIIIADNVEDAVNFSNSFAPEHLQIVTARNKELLEEIENAGSVFLGNYTPVASGDYASGTNHVLPTSGFARAYSGLNIRSFLKIIFWQKLSKEGIKKLSKVIIPLAEAEGLKAHADSVKIRVKED